MPAIFVCGVIININWKRNTVEHLLKKLNNSKISAIFIGDGPERKNMENKSSA